MKKALVRLVGIRLTDRTVQNPPRLVRANSAFEKRVGE